ncbi:MAG: hypothetical protein AB7K24_31955 [Gemmataceae bacterium]
MSDQSHRCEICQQEIDPERVEVLPETGLCTEHARQMEKYGGEFLVSFTQERLSKAGSLKRNYGGVTPHRRRNHDGLAKLKKDLER